MNGRTHASCPIMKASSYLKERSGLAITHPNKVQPLSEAMAGLFPPAVMTVHVRRQSDGGAASFAWPGRSGGC